MTRRGHIIKRMALVIGALALVALVVAGLSGDKHVEIFGVAVFDDGRFMLGPMVEQFINWLKSWLKVTTRGFADGIETAVDFLTDDMLLRIEPWALILAVAALAWWLARRWGIAVFTLVGLALIWNLELWDETMLTLALVIFSTVVTVVIGVPIGIAGASSKAVRDVVTPILDFMQTLPAFVYLIPAIPFFGPGTAAALVTTVIFSIAPTIRLTTLGIEQVPAELVEAADAFGSTRMQKLLKLQIPLAMPTIRAGVNQTIMLSLSMVVIAALIGFGGLGRVVWEAIQQNEIGQGFESGIAIVILAIVLDRIMQNIRTRAPRRAPAASA
jgi:glycine betaine/proline transport system permease protein